ncbi:SufD family Fe-S cluster assembly protein, partial [Candidatus Geothermarchaeota archaeon]
KIVGSAEGSSGHIECDGLLLSNDSEIVTIPELIAKHNNIRLTHEASIGRIAEEQILYLMSKGFNEDEAKEIIVRGFMKIDIPDLSGEMRKTIEQAIIVASRGL